MENDNKSTPPKKKVAKKKVAAKKAKKKALPKKPGTKKAKKSPSTTKVAEVTRARNDDGEFVGDDPTTPLVDEAWVATNDEAPTGSGDTPEDTKVEVTADVKVDTPEDKGEDKTAKKSEGKLPVDGIHTWLESHGVQHDDSVLTTIAEADKAGNIVAVYIDATKTPRVSVTGLSSDNRDAIKSISATHHPVHFLHEHKG